MDAPRADTPADLILRDQLAVDRTELANERTLLSYVRTALTLVGGGIGLVKFFDGGRGWVALGVAAIAGGIAVMLLGAWRFAHVRTRLARARG